MIQSVKPLSSKKTLGLQSLVFRFSLLISCENVIIIRLITLLLHYKWTTFDGENLMKDFENSRQTSDEIVAHALRVNRKINAWYAVILPFSNTFFLKNTFSVARRSYVVFFIAALRRIGRVTSTWSCPLALFSKRPMSPYYYARTRGTWRKLCYFCSGHWDIEWKTSSKVQANIGKFFDAKYASRFVLSAEIKPLRTLRLIVHRANKYAAD